MSGEPLSNSLSILYVEDDADVRAQFTHMLGKIAGTLHVACDGAEGMEMFGREKPDLVVSDIMMPVMDGLEMAEKIRAESPDTPIIMTTAFNDAKYLLRAIAIGVDGYVLKPVDYHVLRRTIEKSLRVLFSQRELKLKNAQLELYHAAAEEERRLVAQLMERMMQADGLREEGLHYWLQPSDVVSGDLIAAARARSGRLFVMVADSTGHGLPAALNLLPLRRIFYRMVEKGYPVGTLVEEMNSTIKEQSPTDRFVAATLASVDAVSQAVEIWIGGNPAALFVDAAGNLVHAFASANLPLGILDKTFVAHPVLFRWREPGYLLMFSDGLLEAENEAGEALGADRVLQAIAGIPAGQWMDAIRETQRRHLGARRAHDDVSLVLVDCSASTDTGAD